MTNLIAVIGNWPKSAVRVTNKVIRMSNLPTKCFKLFQQSDHLYLSDYAIVINKISSRYSFSVKMSLLIIYNVK